MRIAGVNIPPQKHIEIGLTHIYGIGRSLAGKICDKLGIDRQAKVKELTEDDADRIREELNSEEYSIEGNLRRERANNIKRLMDLGCNRGTRHRRGYPVRGQRTKTNARTRKGKRKSSN